MKKIIGFTLTFLLLLVTSCSYPSDSSDSDDDWDFVEVEKVIKDNIKGKCGGNTYNIKLNELIDDKENPYYNIWEEINMYPLKEYRSHRFEDIGFEIFADSNDYILIQILIEDEVIEYDIQVEEVYNEETGEITFVETKTEIGRYTETIDLTEGGKKIKLNGTKGKSVDFFVDYVIKDYSASTAFTIVVTDVIGNPLTFEWGIDNLEFLVSEIIPDEE